jgi:hypothetical protein
VAVSKAAFNTAAEGIPDKRKALLSGRKAVKPSPLFPNEPPTPAFATAALKNEKEVSVFNISLIDDPVVSGGAESSAIFSNSLLQESKISELIIARSKIVFILFFNDSI